MHVYTDRFEDVGIIVNITIQYPVPLFSLCTKSLIAAWIAVLKDAKQLSEENGGGPFC